MKTYTREQIKSFRLYNLNNPNPVKLFLSILLLGIYALAPGQIPMGDPLFGENRQGRFGHAVSLSADGQWMAVGAPGNFFVLGGSSVYIYKYVKGYWVQAGEKLSGEIPGDKFGTSVSLSGDGKRLAVGMPGRDVFGYNSGIVRVYERNGNDWQPLGSDLFGDASLDMFGFSVALSGDGNHLVVSAPWNDRAGQDAGLVRIFRFNGEDWIPYLPDLTGPEPKCYYGRTVAISDNGYRVAIGSPSFQQEKGLVDIFYYTGGHWDIAGQRMTGKYAHESFGASLALSADGFTIAVGAPWVGGTEEGTGRVRVYLMKNKSWTQLGSDIPGDSGTYDLFGLAVDLSLDGTLLLVGDPEVYHTEAHFGFASLYQYAGDEWEKNGSAAGQTKSEHLGASVAIALDAGYFVAGAPDYGEYQAQSGYVQSYEIQTLTSHGDKVVKNGNLLYQNTPNPVRTTTQISFDLRTSGPVSIQLFDGTGSYCGSLFEGNPGAGSHSFTWHARDILPGIYYYRLIAGNTMITRKMVVN